MLSKFPKFEVNTQSPSPPQSTIQELTLQEKLMDLSRRLATATNDPDQRPTWLHWSDAWLLRDAISHIENIERQLKMVQSAVLK